MRILDSVNKVSSMLSFAGPSGFCKYFKADHGCSPNDYMAQNELFIRMKTKAFIPVLLLAAIAVSSCGTSYKVVETRITALNHYVDQEHPGNADVFSIANCPSLKDSPIKGKTIYWLG